MRRFVAVDLETTGLNPQQDYIAEVGLAGEDYVTGRYFEMAFSLDFPEGAMSAGAAAVNGWGKRAFAPEVEWQWAAAYLTSQLHDVHIVGKNPQFDADFLHVFLQQEGLPTRPWHHRLVDVGMLAWGANCASIEALRRRKKPGVAPPIPWDQPPNVEKVEEMVRIPREKVDGFHTALCDARWAYEVFRNIVPKGN